ncbi:MgtC/SapB family protein [Aquisalinus flavus]|uniref:Protein MgtC n=1 Tax=Aquisalinus flavus TaxID=1526572 RepID=A0A8J2V4B6_9PROT|nr:MgtC/SapB family protein [Aquisalinus flavus]MBD0427452.1 MgtC/SapB family protein [Aquisalinus flavus]UNE47253.1 MgtC/SapB family protein [Aquisalinus flavus]GGD01134.1 magnesium transporter MgtC [Aquisalinus flavus]
MEQLDQIFSTQIGAGVILLRLTLACLLGAVLGLDRELRDRPAGLRTFIMVSLAACLFTMISIELSLALEGGAEQTSIRPDPLRIIQAITAGVAFLAAGSIIRHGKRLEGLTTGAGMWLAGAIGLACGAGFEAIAALVTVMALIILVGLKKLESGLDREK